MNVVHFQEPSERLLIVIFCNYISSTLRGLVLYVGGGTKKIVRHLWCGEVVWLKHWFPTFSESRTKNDRFISERTIKFCGKHFLGQYCSAKSYILDENKILQVNWRILADHKWSADRSLGNTVLKDCDVRKINLGWASLNVQC